MKKKRTLLKKPGERTAKEISIERDWKYDRIRKKFDIRYAPLEKLNLYQKIQLRQIQEIDVAKMKEINRNLDLS